MPSPLAAAKDLLEHLSGGFSPSVEVAQQVEDLMGVLKRYTLQELLQIFDLLDHTSKTKDRSIALDAAKVEVAKQPTKEAGPVEAEPVGVEAAEKTRA